MTITSTIRQRRSTRNLNKTLSKATHESQQHGTWSFARYSRVGTHCSLIRVFQRGDERLLCIGWMGLGSEDADDTTDYMAARAAVRGGGYAEVHGTVDDLRALTADIMAQQGFDVIRPESDLMTDLCITRPYVWEPGYQPGVYGGVLEVAILAADGTTATLRLTAELAETLTEFIASDGGLPDDDYAYPEFDFGLDD